MAHSDAKRAAVVALLIAGHSPIEAAKSQDVDERTVRRWRSEIPEETLSEIAAQKKERFGDLVEGFLAATLTMLTTQCEVASELSYIEKHKPDELAILTGVLSDKCVRVLDSTRGIGGK